MKRHFEIEAYRMAYLGITFIIGAIVFSLVMWLTGHMSFQSWADFLRKILF